MGRLRGTWSLGCILLLFTFADPVHSEKRKRQIFREQLLPALGGKIPEEAFRTDRLALNRLNKEGITVVDGVILEARHVDKHPIQDRPTPEVIKVYATSDGRYVPPEGRYENDRPQTVDTTYVLRTPSRHSQSLSPLVNSHQNGNEKTYKVLASYQEPVKTHSYAKFHNYLPVSTVIHKTPVYEPIIRPLILPVNEAFFGKPFHQTSRDFSYSWGTGHDDSINDFFYHSAGDFNTHQIIADYEGFLHDFHDRSLRHIDNSRRESIHVNSFENQNSELVHSAPTSTHSSSSGNSKFPVSTSLTNIPVTKFSCRGRTGTFADVKTNCQVFHECLGWKKTSSLCPIGTAYSEIAKRCEWSNTFNCS